MSSTGKVADLYELDHVQLALAILVLRNEGLRSVQVRGQVKLGEARHSASLDVTPPQVSPKLAFAAGRSWLRGGRQAHQSAVSNRCTAGIRVALSTGT